MIAFRNPGEKEVHFIKGTWVTSNEADNGFVMAPFSKKDDMYILKNHRRISKDEFFSASISLNDELPHIFSKDQYLQMGDEALQMLKEGSLNKVVLSRVKKVPLRTSLQKVFENLLLLYPDAFIYCAKGPFGLWVGASPEVLIHSSERQLKTVALAGTQLWNSNQKNYQWPYKEQEEQKFVTDYISAIFESLKIQYSVSTPQTARAGGVVHLKSDFIAEIESQNIGFQVLKKLHPTPAVAGIPTSKAINAISHLEAHERKYYTGYLGMISDQKMQLFVNLRSMQVIDEVAYLYVGGGFTEDSVVEDEWQETEHKAIILEQAINKV